MTHPMSEAWLDWQPMKDEPRGYEVVLYLAADGFAWTGNHPEGHARGLWKEGAGGHTDPLYREPVRWARIPLPATHQ